MSRDMARAALTNLAEIKFSLIYLRHMYLRHYGVNFNYGGKIIYGVEINYGITAFTIYGFLLRRYGTCRNRKNNSASTYTRDHMIFCFVTCSSFILMFYC